MCSKHLQKIDEVNRDQILMGDGPSCLSTGLAWKPLTLTDILKDDIELEYFKRFLTKQFALQDLCFWIETENFCTTQNFKDFKARQIRKKFLNHQYFLGPQSPATKEQQSQILSAEGKMQGQRLPARPSSAVIKEAQKHVRTRLESKWLPMYMETSEFKQRHLVAKYDGDRKNSADLTDSQENKFLHRLREDHVSRDSFIQFLAIKEEPGQFLVNDLNFWLEDERFKEMYRNDVAMNMLEKKMQAIITCYLLSPVPPRLQLDISQGIADKITKKDQMSQYIFREAQASVFKNLFSYCTSFQRFSCDHSNSSLPFKELEEEAKKRRESFSRRENAHQASKRLTRNKTENQKQMKSLSNVKERNKVAVAFRLSEFNPQYETLPVCEDSKVSNPKMAIAAVVKTNSKLSNFTKTTCQNMRTVKRTTSCSKKSGAELVSLPPISFATKQNKDSSSKTCRIVKY